MEKINAVHCETQEQWDFVTKTLDYDWNNGVWDKHKELTFINLDYKHYNSIKSSSYDIILYTFKEWCNKFNHKPKSMEKESLAGRYIRCIKQPNASHFTLNKEYKIINGDIWKRNKCKVTDDISYCILDNSFDCFELLSQGYSPIIELTELPEKWCVCPKTEENLLLIKKWFNAFAEHVITFEDNSYTCNKTYHTHLEDSIKLGYTEITFEQFKKWVLKGDKSKVIDNLPEKWCFCVNKENYQKFKHLRSLYSPHGYITSKNFDNLSWGLWSCSVPDDHREISFETFEKYVLNKEVTYDKIKEPVEEKWIPKVGDWVYAEKQDNSDFRKPEFVPVFKIDEVWNEWLRPNRNESTGICKSLCRKALPHEIPIVTSTLENVGDVLDRIQIKHISRSHYPKTPKESFKLNKLPTKSWY